MFKQVNLTPENKTFAEVMGNDKGYEVPLFQRDYSWTEEQLDELWQDVERTQQHKSQHFMGYLVLQSPDGKSFRIIDGQQRITTVTLLIVAILAKFNDLIEQGDEVADNTSRKDETHKRYLGIFNVVTLETAPKLILNRNNKDHFVDIVDLPYGVPRQRGITATNRRLNKAFDFFATRLSSYSGKDLAELIEALGDGLLFTTITVNDDLDAFLVFETLNARGVHLAAPDLLKNYLLSTLQPDDGSDLIISFEQKWSETLQQLGETNFTDFLRSYEGMSSLLKPKKELYRHLKDKVTSADQVMPYIKDIRKHASVYAALQNPDDPFWKEYGDGQYHCVDDLRMLKLFNIKTPLSLLMVTYDKFAAQDFNSLVKWLVVISVRYNVICQKLPGEQERVYNTIAMDVTIGKVSDIHQLKARLKPVYPSDEEFLNAFVTKSMPSRRSLKKTRYLLSTIETHVSGGHPPAENLTLEHVLPAKPDTSWQEYFGLETYNEAIDRLGNMALLSESENQDAGQKDFEQKKRILGDSNISINREFAEYERWDIDSLNRHQRWLARQATAVWRMG